jgi:hypothetical protein
MKIPVSLFFTTRTITPPLEPGEGVHLRLVGCLLLLSGFALVLAALVMLPGFAERLAFAVAGFAVELLGLALLTLGYKSVQTGANAGGPR